MTISKRVSNIVTQVI